VRYRVTAHIEPPFEFEGTTQDATANLSHEINHRHGLGDLEVLEPENTEVVRSDEAFWEDFVGEPFMVVGIARKLQRDGYLSPGPETCCKFLQQSSSVF
jgi:hypothetical protein